VLARVAGVVGQIIKAPVKFLGNLIAGVKGGILKFKEDFLGHLRRGLMSWLFGALAEGGIELPKSFDLKGIIGFLASIFGLTWTNIRSRIVKQIGDKAMGAVEKGVEIFKIISGPEGVGGLWQMLLEKLGDIKEMIFAQIKDFVQDRIISAGITWLIGLLNPAGAFIKACKLIYDVVMFFVNNASRIKKFVDTILDSVADIVRGNIGGVVNKINDVLGQMVPIIIGFLASVIGLGNVGAKVREIVQKLQKPVNQALDFVIKKGLQLAAPIIRGLAGISSKVKAKVAAGKAWAKGKVEAGKAWAKEKVTAVGTKIKSKLSGKGRKEAGAEPGAQPAPADKELERPTVDVPFAMAGHDHTLTFTPSDKGVAVTMASGVKLPLNDQFKKAFNAIEFAQRYIDSIADPEIKAKFAAALPDLLKKFPAPTVAEFEAVYNAIYPKGTVPKELPPGEARKRAADRVRPLVVKAEKLLAAITAWAASTGVPELEKAEFEKAIWAKGKPIWEEEFRRIRAQVAAVLAGFNYKGKPIEFRGSAQTGERSVAKGTTLFSAASFDVDMYVVHPAEFEAIRKHTHSDADHIWPSEEYTPDLVDLQTKIREKLVEAFPNVGRIKDSKIVLRGAAKR
jgi:hypothetical protein